MFGDSQFTSTLSVNFHFPKIPRRTFFVPCCRKEKGAEPAWLKVPSNTGMRGIKMISDVIKWPFIAPMGAVLPTLSFRLLLTPFNH